MLKIAKVNTPEEIEQHKIDKQVMFVRCKSCGHKYMASIEDLLDDPSCRRCGK